MNKKYEDIKYEVYINERKSLVDIMLKESLAFDKAILTLSSSALGLSLTFIRQIIPNIKNGTIYLLEKAWISFGISILITLISFLTCISACKKGIKILEDEYINENKNRKCKNINYMTIITTSLNILSILSFIIGTLFLTFFSIYNF
ncbi:hypothetical protein ES702_01282 [subsurface metagenome]